VRAAFAFGALNLLVATIGTGLFQRELPDAKRLWIWNAAAWIILIPGFALSDAATTWFEDRLYQDEIIFAETTPYQRIVVTRWQDDIRLHLDGHLQFSAADEYRYHESLVRPAVAAALAGRASSEDPVSVLILGGGDGLAAREALQIPGVERVELVDIDRRVVELFRDRELLASLNERSLSDPRVAVHYQDAMVFLREQTEQLYDVILMDLPDPSSVATNKLYTKTFFGLAVRRLSPRGVLVTQASSPFYARTAFWCIAHTLKQAAQELGERNGVQPPLQIVPYHVHIPSFGDWGFVMAVPAVVASREWQLPEHGRFLTDVVFAQSRVFPPDSAAVPTRVNTLDDPVLVRYHTAGWSKWNQ
jgi:spermidine synthase